MPNIGGARPAWVGLVMIIVGAGALLSSPAALAQSLMSDAEARRAIEDSYGVQVLRIEEMERDDIPVFILSVMNPAGDFNEAFQVNVLVMNRQNGQLIPQFRHGNSGVIDSAGGRRDVRESSGAVLRSGSSR